MAGLSVPHTGHGPMPRIELFGELYKGRFFYRLYFQEPGVPETELEANVWSSLRKIYYWGSGEAIGSGLKVNKPADARLLDGLPDPQPFPAWLTAADLDYYAEQFEWPSAGSSSPRPLSPAPLNPRYELPVST